MVWSTRPCGGDARRLGRLIMLGMVLLIVSAALAGAQEARGTISGTVSDSSKGVIPGALVTVTNVAMGTSVPVTTNEEGWFQAPYLIPGTYRVEVELSGFKKFAREVEVRIDDRLEIDVSLELGQSAETVDVTAD